MIIAPRDSKGRFLPGRSYSPTTQFKAGDHWRPHQIFRDRDWLEAEYRSGRSASDIARQFSVHVNAILFWLSKHGIPRRSISETHKTQPRKPLVGPANPMYGKRGAANPNFQGGGTPERQRLYSQAEWRRLLTEVYGRDGYRCRRCAASHTKTTRFNAHHMKPWAQFPEARLEKDNLVTLCSRCHRWVHSTANLLKEFLVGR